MKALWQTGLGLLWLFLIGIGYTQAQDPVFSQFFANKLYLNPAFAGFDPGINVYSAMRWQWVQLGQNRLPYASQNIALSLEAPKLWSGFGLQYTDNQEGEGGLQWRRYEFQYAFRNRVCDDPDKHRFEFSLGFSMNYNQWQLQDFNQLTFSDQLNPFLGVVRGTSAVPNAFRESLEANYFDFSGGALIIRGWGDRLRNSGYYTNVLQMGVAFHNLTYTQNNGAFEDQRSSRYTWHGVYMWQDDFDDQSILMALTARTDLQAAGFPVNNGPRRCFFSYQIGLYSLLADFPGLWAGAWYHSGTIMPDASISSLIVGLGARVPIGSAGTNLQVGVTYDYSLTNFYNSGGGTWELTLSLGLPNASANIPGLSCKRKRSGTRFCPKF